MGLRRGRSRAGSSSWRRSSPSPKALERAGLTLADMDLVDMHEAFAAQVASNLKALASKKFAQEKLGRSEAVGEIDPDEAQRQRRLDRDRPSVRGDRRPHGPLDAARAQEARTSSTALLTVCAAGGLGAAVVLEAA